jgi:hypothetical protein
VTTHGFGWEGEEIFACKYNVSGYLRGVREEAKEGKRGGGFAAAGLAYEAKDFAGVDLERNIFDGWMGAEGDREIGNVQQWRGFHWFDGSEFVNKMWWNVWQRRLAVCTKTDFE